MKLRLPSKKFMLGSFSVLIAIAIVLTVVPAVYAEGEGPLTPIPGLGRPNNATLIKMHKAEGSWYNDQDALLKKADALAAAYQEMINAQAAAGKNVSILQEGLDTFNSEIAACREIHLVAATSIYSTVGFKVNGDVRDRLAAGQQLIDGRASLADAHHRLIVAMADLRRNFAKWRHTRVQAPYRYP